VRGENPEVGTPVSPSPDSLEAEATDSGQVRKLWPDDRRPRGRLFRL